MSKSRLEKFLYALYSLDSSDLPNPLSRIEELYKCLVTGDEAPTFKPLSRVEKYLMTILGVYDADELPNPISRVEVLLYKLATGDDNLDDVKSFLSEHEELLAEIIRNGGVGGNIDIEYVLYTLSTEFNTLYNTAEKPVKSAVLKGQTLVNYFKPLDDVDAGGSVCGFQDGKIVFQFGDASSIWGSSYTPGNLRLTNSLKVSPNTKYFAKLILSKPIDGVVQFGNFKESEYSTSDIITLKNNNTNIYQAIMTTGIDTDYIGVILYHSVAEIVYGELLVVPYQEGMENWDIPFFEGMQSVKMPVLKTVGKNLININMLPIVYNQKICEVIDGIIYMKPTTEYEATRWVISVKPDTTYTFSVKGSTGTVQISNFLQSTHPSIDSRIYLDYGSSSVTFTTSSHTELTLSIFNPKVVNFEISDIQLECGAQETSYEPHKSNVLTVNGDVELRGIGNVKDELNLLTGELTQRIGEIVLDGNMISGLYTSGQDGFISAFFEIPNIKNQPQYEEIGQTYMITNKFISTIFGWDVGFENISIHPTITDRMYLTLKLDTIGITTDMDHEEKLRLFGKYLSENTLTVQYQLATESVKTVDLSVVDQNGNDTKLSTFNDITHVTLSSEGLIPEAELEVATKNEEDLEDSIVYTAYTLSEEFNALYNTAEKPVKSAILKGNTMINYAQITSHNFDEYRTPVQNLNKPLEKGKIYTIIMNIVSQTVTSGITTRFAKDNKGYEGVRTFNGVGLHKHLYTATDDFNQFAPYVNIGEYQTGLSAEYSQLMILEGDYTNTDIPYFEGMQSVKMPVLTTTGKNLLDVTILDEESEGNGWSYKRQGETIEFISDGANAYQMYLKDITSDLINKLEVGKTYTLSSDITLLTEAKSAVQIAITYVDNTYDYIESRSNGSYSIEIKQKIKQIRFRLVGQNSSNASTSHLIVKNIQLEESSTPTSYEPYKSNILTTSEEVELRGVGDVHDELDLITGEVINKFGEIVLNGDENWRLYENQPNQVNTVAFKLSLTNHASSWATGLGYCDRLSFTNGGVMYGQDLECVTTDANDLVIRVSLSKASSVDEFKAWLSNYNIRVVYPFKEEVIKTVDSSVVDQDGNNTKLKTFDDITYVTLSSEGLIPEAELEVAEKVPEVAASMLTISREQEVINATANEQSENADATMIATTEIYEELL